MNFMTTYYIILDIIHLSIFGLSYVYILSAFHFWEVLLAIHIDFWPHELEELVIL